MSRKIQPFFAIRVVISDEDGQLYTRDYVRDQMHLSKDKFVAFAVGDFLQIVTDPWTKVKVKYSEIDPQTVHENRQYKHTTHDESGRSN